MIKTATTIRLLLAAALAAAVLCRPAAALPVARAYAPASRSSSVALSGPNAWESDALEAIQDARRQRGLGRLQWDGRLSAVARQHSEDMAQHDYFDYLSPRLGTLEYRLHRAGVSVPNIRHSIFRHGTMGLLVSQLGMQPRPPHLAQSTHVGVGVARKGWFGGMYTTFVFVNFRTELDPFPTMPDYGRSYRLSGRAAEGYSGLSLVMTLPGGEVVQEPVELAPDRTFAATVAFDRGRGRYVVEVMGQGPLGPVVMDLMNCYAGVPYPPPETGEEEAVPDDLRQAERDMVAMINRERLRAGRQALVLDPRLADVARAHSADMAANGFFAHVSPRLGDLRARMRRAGLSARSFGENIAHNRTLTGAHRGLMDSPAHRRGILDPDMTHVGVGIVSDGQGGLVITQNFSQAFVEHAGADLDAGLLRSFNDARRAQGLTTLRVNATLARIATENNEQMVREGRPDHQHAMEAIRRERWRRAVRVAVLRSADPPEAEHFAEAVSGDFRQIGLAVEQTEDKDGGLSIWTTVLFSE